ncbi:MAG: hypothetical protein ACK55I_06180, partial [bacterium]
RQLCQILESDGTIQAGAVPFRDFSFTAAADQSILPVLFLGLSSTFYRILRRNGILGAALLFIKKRRKVCLHPILLFLDAD